MRPKRFTIFGRTIALAFLLITVLGILFISIAYFATTNFYLASTQYLNKDVAAHIAEFTSPYDAGGLDKRKAAGVFHQAMILSPSAEVYFLDTAGKVLAFDSTKVQIAEWQVPLKQIRCLLEQHGKKYVKGLDPRDPAVYKIFSAHEVRKEGHKIGYIYVILGNSEYRSITNMLLKSHVTTLVLSSFLLAMLLSLLITYYYVYHIERRFRRMLIVLNRFQEGDFTARFTIRESDDLAAITGAFNKMADMLVYQVNRTVESENERKNFIANISHDLRTPLSIARGYMETLLLKKESGISPKDQQEYMQLVLHKILQIENMAIQLFELSRMESARFQPEQEPFVFSEVLNELVNTFRLKADEKNITIICLSCENEYRIYADIRMMERLVQNLLANAVAYAPEKSSVTVSLQAMPGYLSFSVANSGIPLSNDMVEWLNKKGSAGMAGARSEHHAIGLSIVKRIVELHGYNMEVKCGESLIDFTVHMSFYRDGQLPQAS